MTRLLLLALFATETAATFKATRLDEETRRKIQLIKDGKWW